MVSSRRPEVEGTERRMGESALDSAAQFHRVDPRLRVLKAIFRVAVVHTAHVSSRRPEVEGTERSGGSLTSLSPLSFHRVDPRLRVLKGANDHPSVIQAGSFHRVDPRLRVLKGYADSLDEAQRICFIA